MKKLTTQQYAELDKRYIWHPFTPMKPWCEAKEIITIERGEGEFLFDTDGRRYIDGSASIWCNVHGHNVPALNQAVIDQLNQVSHSTLLGLANPPAVLLAEQLIKIAPAGLTKVFYSDNGSTAVEVACKMAYQYWANLGRPRTRYIAFGSAYHGDTIGAVSLGGIGLFHQAFKSLCFEVDFVPPPTNERATLAAVEKLLGEHQGQHAAIVVEPLILGAGGMIMYGPDVLRQLRALADRYDTLLVFDEVMTGFGRTGKMFAADHAGVTPDLMCLSKGLTAGYMPLGVTLTTQRIFDAFYADPREGKTFFHGHTFTGHPLACAVALRSLELFEENQLLAHVNRLEPILAEMLSRARGRPFVGAARHCGLVGAIELVDANGQPFDYHWRIGGALCTRLREKGLMMRPLADVVVLMPPLAIREENFRHFCEAVLDSLSWLPEIVAQKRNENRP